MPLRYIDVSTYFIPKICTQIGVYVHILVLFQVLSFILFAGIQITANIISFLLAILKSIFLSIANYYIGICALSLTSLLYSLPSVPGNQYSTLCLYELDCSWK
jgi:hypothetical protein